MTEFTELYKKLSNSQLLKIIAEFDKYNPVAVETAKIEIESRHLTQQEINDTNYKIGEQEKRRDREFEKRKHREEKIRNTTSVLLDTINPIHRGTQAPEKIIRLTTLIFGGLTLFNFYQEFSLIHFMFSDDGGEWDLSMVEYFLPLILLPVAVLLFWNRKRSGWILLAVFMTYSAVTAFGLFLMDLGKSPSGIPALENLFPTVSPIAYILTMLFYTGFLLLICRQGVRNEFNILKSTAIKTILFTGIANLFFMYSMLG